jgi:hypothetical protein
LRCLRDGVQVPGGSLWPGPQRIGTSLARSGTGVSVRNTQPPRARGLN